VLSACDSQKGRLERDEGMLALPLGFCFAGAPAVVASLWKVDDESTALLMSDFYRRILSDGAPGPCEALHAARRELKKKHPDPRHWGAFVFVGAP
jgi:CHAT domain-containing protein